MNPTIGKEIELKFKIEDVDKLDDGAKFSEAQITTGNLQWKLKVYTHTSNKVKYLSVFLDSVDRSSNSLCEVKSKFKLCRQSNYGDQHQMFSNPPSYYSNYRTSSWGYFDLIEWSNLLSDGYIDNNSIFVDVIISYKCYNFTKGNSIYCDVSINVKSSSFHISKGFLCTFSKYFYAKFANNKAASFSILDVDAFDFAHLLAAISPDPIDINARTYDILMDLSKKFEIESLNKRCQDYFVKNTCVELTEKIKKAETNNNEELMKDCVASLKRGIEAKLFAESAEFQKFKESTKILFFKEYLKFL